MCQCLLIESTRTLNYFSKGVEYLTRNSYSLEEIRLTGSIDELFARVVPVEVHNRFLES